MKRVQRALLVSTISLEFHHKEQFVDPAQFNTGYIESIYIGVLGVNLLSGMMVSLEIIL